jgi:hypothetical protein
MEARSLRPGLQIEYPRVWRMLHSFNEIHRFFRNVSVVNQHKLAKPDVCPENAKSKNKLAQDRAGD